MKGSATAAVLAVVAVLILVGAFYYMLSTGQINVGTGVGRDSYSNNVVTISNLIITNSEPIEGTATSVSFYVQNNGDRPVEAVVDITDMPGFDKSRSRIKCNDVTLRLGETNCTLNLDKLDSQPVEFRLQAVDLVGETDQKVRIQFKVKYRMYVSREIFIPVVVDPRIAPAGTQYQESAAPYSPISVDFDAPIGATRKEGDTTVVERFARVDVPFQLKIKVKDVSGRPASAVEPIFFDPLANTDPVDYFYEGNYFSLLGDEFEILGCDKMASISGGFPTTQVTPSIKLKIPFEVDCTLQTFVDENEINGFRNSKFRVIYGFDYSFTNHFDMLIKTQKTGFSSRETGSPVSSTQYGVLVDQRIIE